jgi:hypothetical protein
MPQLRSALVEPREAFGELADALPPRVNPDGGAFQRAILGEAADDRLDVAGIECRGVACASLPRLACRVEAAGTNVGASIDRGGDR